MTLVWTGLPNPELHSSETSTKSKFSGSAVPEPETHKLYDSTPLFCSGLERGHFLSLKTIPASRGGSSGNAVDCSQVSIVTITIPKP